MRISTLAMMAAALGGGADAGAPNPQGVLQAVRNPYKDITGKRPDAITPEGQRRIAAAEAKRARRAALRLRGTA